MNHMIVRANHPHAFGSPRFGTYSTKLPFLIHAGTHGHNKVGVARDITMRDDTIVAH